MTNLEYYVMKTVNGSAQWLQDDERTWTPSFHGAQAFNDPELADDIAKRETKSGDVYFVMAAMSSR